MKEEQILHLLRSKDPRGLEAAIDQYGAYVSTVVWNCIRDAMPVSDGEEAASDVFLALWDQAGDVQPGKLKAWLAAVARNTARHKLREKGRDLPLEGDLLEVSDGSTPLDAVLAEEERRAVRQAVEDMGEPDREIFLRHYYYIQPLGEISREMGIRESTVKSRLRRGREKLKQRLQEWGIV